MGAITDSGDPALPGPRGIIRVAGKPGSVHFVRGKSMVAVFRPNIAALGVVAVALGFASQMQAQAPSCEPIGDIRFVCGQDGPEDLVAVPGSPWLVASAFGPSGGLFAINTKVASSTRLFPTATAASNQE